jgi:hypothetical protein
MRKGDRVVSAPAPPGKRYWFADKVGVIVQTDEDEVGVRFMENMPIVWFLPKELKYAHAAPQHCSAEVTESKPR